MAVEEVQHCLVPTLILLDNLGIFQIGTSGHPAVNLRRESLHVVGHGQIRLEGLHVIGRFVLGRQAGERHVDGLGIVGIDHCGMALCSRLEDLVIGTGGEGSDLSAPAEAQDGPGLEGSAGGGLVGFLDDIGDLGEGLGRCGLGLEEVAQLLLVFVGGGRVPGDVGGAAFEEIGDVDAVFLVVGGGEDVGALDGLVKEAEDVYGCSVSYRDAFCARARWRVYVGTRSPLVLTVDEQDGLGGSLGARDVCTVVSFAHCNEQSALH